MEQACTRRGKQSIKHTIEQASKEANKQTINYKDKAQRKQHTMKQEGTQTRIAESNETSNEAHKQRSRQAILEEGGLHRGGRRPSSAAPSVSS